VLTLQRLYFTSRKSRTSHVSWYSCRIFKSGIWSKISTCPSAIRITVQCLWLAELQRNKARKCTSYRVSTEWQVPHWQTSECPSVVWWSTGILVKPATAHYITVWTHNGQYVTGPASLAGDGSTDGALVEHSFVFTFVFLCLCCHTAYVLYYCNTVGWTWRHWSLILRTCLQCFDTVGWVIWPVKTRPRYDL